MLLEVYMKNMFKPDICVIFKSNIEVATLIHPHPKLTPIHETAFYWNYNK